MGKLSAYLMSAWLLCRRQNSLHGGTFFGSALICFAASIYVLIRTFQDDFWRRNSDTIGKLRQYASDFDPHYPSSIAYTPLPRAALESFLTQRGLLNRRPKRGDFIDNGFLNKVYVRMYDVAFHRSSEVKGISACYCILRV